VRQGFTDDGEQYVRQPRWTREFVTGDSNVSQFQIKKRSVCTVVYNNPKCLFLSAACRVLRTGGKSRESCGSVEVEPSAQALGNGVPHLLG